MQNRQQQGKNEEKLLNCFEKASLISKLAQFTDQIQRVSGKSPDINDLGPKILKTLIDLNPFISEIVERTEARTNIWPNEEALMKYIKICITPPVRAAIKNLFLESFNYETAPEHHILEPSADANDMRLKLHEERISNNEIVLAKIDIVAETVAREVADMKLAMAAGAFECEEDKRETIVALVTELLNERMAKRSQILLIK